MNKHFDYVQSISNSKSRTFSARQEITTPKHKMLLSFSCEKQVDLKRGGELNETFKKPSFNVKNSNRRISEKYWQALLYSAYDLSS